MTQGSPEAKGTNFHLLIEDPLVAVISAGWLFETGIAVCDRVARGGPCHVIVVLPWHLLGIFGPTVAFAKRLGTARPQYRLTFMCPTQEETEDLRHAGFEAIHVHHNAFLDERIHHPGQHGKRDFDAVHIAQSGKFKRHELAWNVPNLALVTYSTNSITLPPGAEPDETIAGYRHLAWSNWTRAEGLRLLTPDEVAAVTRRACCGLILSAVEGSNFATTEYMLNGLPVVSTPSRGGRDEFFDPRFVHIVPPEAAAVEAAVAGWKADQPDPQVVHDAAMALMRPHRLRFLEWLSEATGKDLLKDATPDFWSPLFVNRLRQGAMVEPSEITVHAPGPTMTQQLMHVFRQLRQEVRRAARPWIRRRMRR